MFKPEKYTPPKFDREPFISFPDVTTEKAGGRLHPGEFLRDYDISRIFQDKRRVEDAHWQPHGLLRRDKRRHAIQEGKKTIAKNVITYTDDAAAS